jgi:hypothetical protein
MSFQVKSSNMQMNKNSVQVRKRPILRLKKVTKNKKTSEVDESLKDRPKHLRGMTVHNNRSDVENFF